jgi:hypothetical protein
MAQVTSGQIIAGTITGYYLSEGEMYAVVNFPLPPGNYNVQLTSDGVNWVTGGTVGNGGNKPIKYTYELSLTDGQGVQVVSQ